MNLIQQTKQGPRTSGKAGFWEQGGYHMHGDPWKEERFRFG